MAFGTHGEPPSEPLGLSLRQPRHMRQLFRTSRKAPKKRSSFGKYRIWFRFSSGREEMLTRYTLQGRGAKRYFFEVWRITISLTNSFQRRIKQLRPYDSHTSDHVTLNSLISARFYALIPATFKKSRFEKKYPNHGQNRVQIRVLNHHIPFVNPSFWRSFFSFFQNLQNS